jgi:hypothetical protein
VKALEREMKDEARLEEERKRQALKERRERREEKKGLEEMKARMSAKKLQRMKKVSFGLEVQTDLVGSSLLTCPPLFPTMWQRLGRSKKING